MDWVAVLIQTRMMMTCNYNVQFHFVLGAIPSLALSLWLQCDKWCRVASGIPAPVACTGQSTAIKML
jgi:hypothetical protein